MSSPVIVARNRANAAHSTGPSTAQGKARSARNALKLGLSIQRHVILEGEDPAAFQALHADLLRVYDPQCEREELAIQEIAHCCWAFRRFDTAEVSALSQAPLDPATMEPMEDLAMLDYLAATPTAEGEAQPEWKPIHNLMRYRAYWERRHQRALTEFDRAQIARYRAERELRAQESERRAEERHQMALDRQRMAAERHQQAMEQRQSAGRAADENANRPPNSNKPKPQPASGFVPYSDPKLRNIGQPFGRNSAREAGM